MKSNINLIHMFLCVVSGCTHSGNRGGSVLEVRREESMYGIDEYNLEVATVKNIKLHSSYSGCNVMNGYVKRNINSIHLTLVLRSGDMLKQRITDENIICFGSVSICTENLTQFSHLSLHFRLLKHLVGIQFLDRELVLTLLRLITRRFKKMSHVGVLREENRLFLQERKRSLPCGTLMVITMFLLEICFLNYIVELTMTMRARLSQVRSGYSERFVKEISTSQQLDHRLEKVDLWKFALTMGTEVAPLDRGKNPCIVLTNTTLRLQCYERLYEEEHKLHSSYSASSDLPVKLFSTLTV
ncbi:unnamed protein product [Cochlearia groenlandica]